MLDVVAANQNEPATAVDPGRLDHPQPRLPPARGARPEPDPAEAADRTERHHDQRQGDQKCEKELHGGRQLAKGSHRCSLATLTGGSSWCRPIDSAASRGIRIEKGPCPTRKRPHSTLFTLRGRLMRQIDGERPLPRERPCIGAELSTGDRTGVGNPPPS